jgi:hypothetical protein
MLEGCKLAKLMPNQNTQLSTYHHCLAMMMCNSQQSFFKYGSDKLQDLLGNLPEENAIEHVFFKQWISTDRSTLETTVKPSDGFTNMLIAKLAVLHPHSFVAVQQAMYLKELKSGLQVGVVIVLCNFAENYSFILQHEAQGFHWNNDHVTLQPFAIYF